MIQLPSTEFGHICEHNISIRPVTLTQGAQEAQRKSQVQQKIKTAEKTGGAFFMGATSIHDEIPPLNKLNMKLVK